MRGCPVGTGCLARGRRQGVCAVVGRLTTTNDKGGVVRTRYVASHDFCGQPVLNRDVCAVTIARGLINKAAG